MGGAKNVVSLHQKKKQTCLTQVSDETYKTSEIMKKFIYTMMIMAMTVIGTTSSYGATKVYNHKDCNHSVCANSVNGRSHFKTNDRNTLTVVYNHNHTYNRYGVCVKCNLTKKTIDEIKRKNNKKSNKPCPVCSHKNNKHRR